MTSVGIVGAGPGGLSVAMLLANAGCDVTIYERSATVGGRTKTLVSHAAQGDFRFDSGPTFFLYPRVLEDIFSVCGRKISDAAEMMRIDPLYDLVFGDGTKISARHELAKMQAEIAKLAPADAEHLPRYMEDNRAKLAAFRPVLESAFNGVRDMMHPALLAALPRMRPWSTMDRDLKRYFRDPRVRLAFSFQAKYLGMSPFKCPSLFTILPFMEYEYGVWHPRGGCGELMAGMGRVGRSMGVRIRTNTPVDQIAFDGRAARGVYVDGERIDHDAVVVNADFGHAMTTLIPDVLRRRWSDKQLAKKKFSCSTFMLYLGIKGRIDGVAHHTILLADDYKRNIREIEDASAPPKDPSIYVQNASITDDTLAPEGYSTLYALAPVGHLREGGADWDALKRDFRNRVIAQLARIGITDLEDRIVTERIITPNDWHEDFAVYRGATFNLAHGLDQMLLLRPRNRFEDLDNLYLVGGGTHPGSGLPVIFESARITARLLAEDFGLSTQTQPEPHALQPALEPAVA